MLIEAHLLPGWLLAASGAVTAAVLLWCIRYAPWRALVVVPARLHCLLGGLLLLLLLRLLSIHVTDGLYLHLLGVPAVTLLVGLRFTLLVGAVAVLVSYLFSGHPMPGAPLAWALSVALPAVLVRWLVAWLRRRPAHHPFIFIMGAGFAGGVLSALATGAAGLAVLAIIGQQDWVSSALANWPVILLIAFPEGFIDGTVVTAFAVLAPYSMKLFDSDFYYADR